MRLEFINCWNSLNKQVKQFSLFHIGYFSFGEDDEYYGNNFSLIFLGFGINITIN